MAWFKQLCLSWIILSATAACVSCQELTSTLRDGNRTCPGEEVIFTCTIRGSSTLSVIAVAWSSNEYIGQGDSLQLSTANIIGAVETSTGMDGSTTATATVTNNTNVNGELILESTLRITIVEPSTVTCNDPNRGPASIEFTVSAVPGIPQRIDAAEISRPVGTICIILVEWDPPANSDPSDIDQYIVYVLSQNIRDVSSSTISTLTVSNCGDNIRVQVAAVNDVGCVGMNSSEVQLTRLDIPAVPTEDAPATVERRSTDGSTSTSTIIAIAICVPVALIALVVVVILFAILCYWKVRNRKKIAENAQVLKLKLKEFEETNKDLVQALKSELEEKNEALMQERFGSSFGYLYDALKRNEIPSMQVAIRQLLDLILEKEMPSKDIKEALETVMEKRVTSDSAAGIRFALRQLKKMIPRVMSTFDNDLKNVFSSVTITMDKLIEAAEEGKHEELFEELKQIVNEASSEDVKGHLLKCFEALGDYLYTKAEKELLQKDFAKNLKQFIKAIRESDSTLRSSILSTALVPTFAHELLELMKNMSPNDIQEVLTTTVFESKVISARDIQHTLHQLKERIPEVMSSFDTQLSNVFSSVTITMDKLIEAAEEGKHEELFEELKQIVNEASSEDVKGHLQKLLEALVLQDDNTDESDSSSTQSSDDDSESESEEEPSSARRQFYRDGDTTVVEDIV